MLNFPAERPLACITIGRANLDLYPPVGQQLCQARRYDAFVGGSPANIAAGLVKRGLRAAIITKVADDGVGQFVINYLKDFGIDVSQVLQEGSEARTSLAFAERRRDAVTVFYRQQPSDLLLEAADIDPSFIARSQVLFLSGTAVCGEPCRSAVQSSIAAARQAGTVVAMDIDYRPHGWESPEQASTILKHFAAQSELLIGTAEEFCIASGLRRENASKLQEEKQFQKMFPRAQLLVVKRGKEGANAYARGAEPVLGSVLPAALKKPWGAGDAFASSLLASLLRGKALSESMRDAAASASLNISGESCTEAMPSTEEIEHFLEQQGRLSASWKD